jgi:hypothetical protein
MGLSVRRTAGSRIDTALEKTAPDARKAPHHRARSEALPRAAARPGPEPSDPGSQRDSRPDTLGRFDTRSPADVAVVSPAAAARLLGLVARADEMESPAGRITLEVLRFAAVRLVVAAVGTGVAAASSGRRSDSRVVRIERRADREGWSLVFPSTVRLGRPSLTGAPLTDQRCHPESIEERRTATGSIFGVLIGYARCSTDKQAQRRRQRRSE